MTGAVGRTRRTASLVYKTGWYLVALSIGIVGLPNVGKSTLFTALTKKGGLAANYPFATIDPNVGIVDVPDDRLQALADIVHPGRIVPATVEFVDIAGLVKGANEGEGLGNQFLANIRDTDAICEVVRYFKAPNVMREVGRTGEFVDPAADAECIIMLMEYFERLGFARENLRLVINSMGDSACRPAYRDKVRAFILDHADEMCEDCLERAQINPLRAFDCKNDHCREVMKGAPLAPDNLCEECAAHYEAVKRYLDAAGVSYVEDPTLVRGLDYYTRTVFEVEAVGSGVGAIGGGHAGPWLCGGLRAHRARPRGGRRRDGRRGAELRLRCHDRRRGGAPGGLRRVPGASRGRRAHRGRLPGPLAQVPVQAGRQAARAPVRGARRRRGRRRRGDAARHVDARAVPGAHGGAGRGREGPPRVGRRAPRVCSVLPGGHLKYDLIDNNSSTSAFADSLFVVYFGSCQETALQSRGEA